MFGPCIGLSQLKNWQHSIKYCQEGIEFYSKNIGTYPYNQVTTLEGGLGMGGGMEYPMINIISGHMKNKKLLERVIVHEIGHNWFQGILASMNVDILLWMRVLILFMKNVI